MLATSAVMLSTATYAWFTMNKEVQMTGLKMTATTGEGIEISLASITGSNTLTFTGYTDNHPSDSIDELGWKSSVAVGQYYDKIGKLKPVSSADGATFYDATDASDKGRQASTFTAVTLNDTTMADLTPHGTLAAADTTVSADTAANSSGYYVDIPVHIRTTKTGTSAETTEYGDLYCKLIIKNGGTNDANETLYNAVRVAFIPITANTNPDSKIFGVDDEYYNSKVVGAGGSLESSTGIVVKNDCVTSADFASVSGVDSGLNIPLAKPGETYGHLDFNVRVWLEGQSTSCYDDKAGQSWNIDLAFSLGEFTTTQGN